MSRNNINLDEKKSFPAIVSESALLFRLLCKKFLNKLRVSPEYPLSPRCVLCQHTLSIP